jgi:hypothetical protein
VADYLGAWGLIGSDFPVVDREQALSLLPQAYAQALRLFEAGAGRQVIVEQLGVEPESVGPLLKVGRAKLVEVITITDVNSMASAPNDLEGHPSAVREAISSSPPASGSGSDRG